MIANFKVRSLRFSLVIAMAAGLLGLLWQATGAAEAGSNQAIRAEIASLATSGRLVEDAVRAVDADLIGEIYERREFAPAWQDPEQIEALLEAVRAADSDGLIPADYRLDAIEKVQQAGLAGIERSSSQRAVDDLLLTDGLIRLVYHLCCGKVDPETRGPMRAYGRPLHGRDAADVIDEIISSHTLVRATASLAPRSAGYQRLKAQLQRHRAIALAGGWPGVPEGPTIRPGAVDPRLEILARRLAISGDLVESNAAIPAARYGPVLEAATRRFQLRHGLEPDGLVGPATLAALNVPLARRIDQIRLNLERARWRSGIQTDEFVLINVAGFRMYVIRDGEAIATKKVIVGEQEDRTPLFRAMLRYIEFNPSWTVPYSIASEEFLPELKTDPEYLEKGEYQLFDRDGNIVDSSAVDWGAIHTGNFPYTVVQRPGAVNQLGQVKFLFPNDYSVCMHDTPAKALFSKAGRAFSHGCIRVDEPIKLAELLLADEGWTRARIDAQIDSGETERVNLANPLPVVILYWTAEVSDRGEMHFYRDIYDRDAAVLEALDRSM